MEFSWKRSGLLYLAMLLGVVAIATVLFSTPSKPTEIPIREAITMSNGSNIKTITEEGEWLTITTTDGKSVKTNIGVLNYNDLRQLGLNSQAPYEIKPLGINWGNIIFTFLPMILNGVF